MTAAAEHHRLRARVAVRLRALSVLLSGLPEAVETLAPDVPPARLDRWADAAVPDEWLDVADGRLLAAAASISQGSGPLLPRERDLCARVARGVLRWLDDLGPIVAAAERRAEVGAVCRLVEGQVEGLERLSCPDSARRERQSA